MSSALFDSLPSGVARAAHYLTECGHAPEPSAAMAYGTFGGDAKLAHPVRKALRPYLHLRMTPVEREGFAGALQARRVLAEGLLLSLGGDAVAQGTVLTAHKLCEARAVRRPLGLSIGGGVASDSQVQAARERLLREVAELDDLVEAAVAHDATLSVKDQSAKPNVRVVHLQNRLNSLGHRVQADGKFGPITEEAVKDFQTRAGVEPTGVVDEITADALRRGGKTAVLNAPPGVMPGQPQTPGQAPRPVSTPAVNQETGNSASQQPAEAPGGQPPEKNESGQTNGAGEKVTTASPDGEKRKGSGKRRISVHLDLGEAAIERLQQRLDDALAMRQLAIEENDGTGVRVANARADVFRRHLEEAKLKAKKRNELPSSDFVFPKERRYPIHDEEHARKALQLSGGKPEHAAVVRKVKKRYPNIQIQEADSKADFPSTEGTVGSAGLLPDGYRGETCPKCGAPVRANGVCQRGHRVGGKTPSDKAPPVVADTEMKAKDSINEAWNEEKIAAERRMRIRPGESKSSYANRMRMGIRPGESKASYDARVSGRGMASPPTLVRTQDGRKISMPNAQREQTDYMTAHGKRSPFLPSHIKPLDSKFDPSSAGDDKIGALASHISSNPATVLPNGTRVQQGDTGGHEVIRPNGEKMLYSENPRSAAAHALVLSGHLERVPREMQESAQTAALSSTHAPIGKGGKNWVTRTAPGNTGQLPAYIQNIRNAMMRGGKSESDATATAIAAVKRWAAGGGKVSAEVRAAASKAVAEWEALKGKSHAQSAAKKA